jgi:hypothetical protein
MERTVGATELRQCSTEVLQAVGEEREAFFDWLDKTSSENATRNLGLSDDEVLAIIEQARSEAWD